MKLFVNVVLVILVLLAGLSGVSKVMLMPQDVEFFSQYGFTNSVLIIFGVVQLLGGLLLIFSKTRIIGAIIVLLTFLISAVVLLMSGKIMVAFITLVFVGLAGLIINQTLNAKAAEQVGKGRFI